MLTNLTIKNYILINELEIDFQKGFSVITGETGAGKSILLGAISLILGQRADTKVLLNKNKKCIIEGTFFIKNYELNDFFKYNELEFEENTIIRREINKNGKSRAFINDTPATLNILKELGNKLIDIHSQKETITLNDSNFQLAVIDNYSKHNSVLKQYFLAFNKYKQLQSTVNELIEKEKQSKANKDYYEFLFEELENANLNDENEQKETEDELQVLNNAENIKKNLYQASLSLNNDDNCLTNQLAETNSLIKNIADYTGNIKEIYERLNSCYIELKDISNEIQHLEQHIIYDPERIELLNNKLNVIYHLQQKHNVNTVKELIKIKESLSDNLQKISSFDNNINKLKSKISEQNKILTQLAKKISSDRTKSILLIQKEITNILSLLGMPDAQIKIQHTILNDFSYNGTDKVKFLFNANKGNEPRELSKVASGGELSRLMLSIKSLISQHNLLPTIIFDEIDIGISGGNIANKVADILTRMSKQMQLIVITHLPQIAARGDIHYLIYKKSFDNVTNSVIKKLNNSERINEISEMLGNSKTATQTAKELLNN